MLSPVRRVRGLYKQPRAPGGPYAGCKCPRLVCERCVQPGYMDVPTVRSRFSIPLFAASNPRAGSLPFPPYPFPFQREHAHFRRATCSVLARSPPRTLYTRMFAKGEFNDCERAEWSVDGSCCRLWMKIYGTFGRKAPWESIKIKKKTKAACLDTF